MIDVVFIVVFTVFVVVVIIVVVVVVVVVVLPHTAIFCTTWPVSRARDGTCMKWVCPLRMFSRLYC